MAADVKKGIESIAVMIINIDPNVSINIIILPMKGREQCFDTYNEAPTSSCIGMRAKIEKFFFHLKIWGCSTPTSASWQPCFWITICEQKLNVVFCFDRRKRSYSYVSTVNKTFFSETKPSFAIFEMGKACCVACGCYSNQNDAGKHISLYEFPRVKRRGPLSEVIEKRRNVWKTRVGAHYPRWNKKSALKKLFVCSLHFVGDGKMVFTCQFTIPSTYWLFFS